MITMLPDGSLVSDLWKDSPLADLVLVSLFTPRGALFLRPGFGSDLHLLNGAKASESTLQMAKQAPSNALKWAIDSGLLDSVSSEAEIQGSRLALKLVIQGQSDSLTLDLWFPVVAGGAP